LTVAVSPAAPATFGLVKSGKAVLTNDFREVGYLLNVFLYHELIYVFDENSLFVFLYNFFHGIHTQWEWGLTRLAVVDEVHHALENVGLEM
jgi:hypothetical protein